MELSPLFRSQNEPTWLTASEPGLAWPATTLPVLLIHPAAVRDSHRVLRREDDAAELFAAVPYDESHHDGRNPWDRNDDVIDPTAVGVYGVGPGTGPVENGAAERPLHGV